MREISVSQCTLTYFVAFGMRSELNAPKMEIQHSVSLSRQCCSTPVGFGQGLFGKEQCDDTGASPTLSWPRYSWFLPFPSIEISIEGTELLWCCGLH